MVDACPVGMKASVCDDGWYCFLQYFSSITCFRDDVVFIVYLWQRYLYPVDVSRPAEGGGEVETSSAVDDEKKKQ